MPSEEAHAQTYESANWLFNVIRGQDIDLEMKEIDDEARIAEMEIRAILERLLEIGDGDIIVGCMKGTDSGIIDSAFSPNKHVRDRVMGDQGLQGSHKVYGIRQSTFPEEVRDFHRQKVAEREKVEGRKMDYEVIVQDFWAFSKGQIKGT